MESTAVPQAFQDEFVRVRDGLARLFVDIYAIGFGAVDDQPAARRAVADGLNLVTAFIKANTTPGSVIQRVAHTEKGECTVEVGIPAVAVRVCLAELEDYQRLTEARGALEIAAWTIWRRRAGSAMPPPPPARSKPERHVAVAASQRSIAPAAPKPGHRAPIIVSWEQAWTAMEHLIDIVSPSLTRDERHHAAFLLRASHEPDVLVERVAAFIPARRVVAGAILQSPDAPTLREIDVFLRVEILRDHLLTMAGRASRHGLPTSDVDMLRGWLAHLPGVATHAERATLLRDIAGHIGALGAALCSRLGFDDLDVETKITASVTEIRRNALEIAGQATD